MSNSHEGSSNDVSPPSADPSQSVQPDASTDLSPTQSRYEKEDDSEIRRAKSFKKNILMVAPTIKQTRSAADGTSAIGIANVENHPSWLELFFDLAIVLACGTLVHDFSLNLTQHNGWFPPFLYLFRLIPIINLWSSLDQYYNRFGQTESLADSILALLLFVVVGCISQNIVVSALRYDAENIKGGYLLTLNEINALLAIGHFTLLCFNIRVAFLVREAAWFVVSYCVYHGFMTVMWILLLQFEYNFWFAFAWTLIANILEFEKLTVLLLIADFLKRRFPKEYVYIPLNAKLMTERMGLLVIVALGEIIASVFAINLKVDSYGTTIMIVVQGFLMKFAYFDVFDAPGERASKHALRTNKFMGVMHYRLNFVVIGAILSSSMYLISASHEDLYSSSGGHDRRHRQLAEAGDDAHAAAGDDDHATGAAAVLNDDTTYSRIRYRQTIYAISCVTVLLCCYFLGLTNVQYPYLQRKQLVPVSVRTIFMLWAGVIMLIAGAAVDYDDRLSLIAVEMSIFAFCLFFEFMCKWFILKPREVKANDTDIATSTAGGGGVSNSNGSICEQSQFEFGDVEFSELIARRTQVRRRSTGLRDLPPGDIEMQLEMQEHNSVSDVRSPIQIVSGHESKVDSAPGNSSTDDVPDSAAAAAHDGDNTNSKSSKARRKSSLLAFAEMSYQLPTAEMLKAGDTSKNSNRRLQQQVGNRSSESSARYSESSVGGSYTNDVNDMRYSVI